MYSASLDEKLKEVNMLDTLTDHILSFEASGWMEHKSPESQSIVDGLWRTFHSVLMEVANEVIGVKIVKPHHKFWYVIPSIQQHLKNQQALRRQYLKGRIDHQELLRQHYLLPEEEREQNYIAVNRSRSSLHHLMRSWRESKQQFYSSIRDMQHLNWVDLLKQMNNPEQRNQVQWKVFRRTLGTKVVDCCQIRDSRGNHPQDRAESLNNLAKYFSDISTLAPIPRKEIVSVASHIDSSSFSSHMQHFPSDPCLKSAPQFNSQNNEPISLEQVTSYCKTMPTNTALGCDFLSPYLLKYGTDLLFQCLHKFFLITFNLGVLPSDWLRSNIFSLYKSGDKHLPENFRPISLTPIIIRLYERLLLPKIWHILDTNQIIHPFQAGFRKNHGTLDCLYWFTQHLNRKFTSKRSYRVKPFLPVVFLDLKKAFDKISVPLMLKKLHACGIRGNLLHFFHAFLTCRGIRAIHFDEASEWYSTDLGTPTLYVDWLLLTMEYNR
jgi:hypothetical protein